MGMQPPGRACREASRQPEIALAAVVLRPVVLYQRLAGPRSLRGALQKLPERLLSASGRSQPASGPSREPQQVTA